MGANTIRLYTFKTSQRHKYFLDAAERANLIVMGAFEIGTAEHTSLATQEDRNKVKQRLERQMRFSRHPVLTMWFVGNEMNGPWQVRLSPTLPLSSLSPSLCPAAYNLLTCAYLRGRASCARTTTPRSTSTSPPTASASSGPMARR